MAIEILKQPADLAWSRNPIVFGFRSNNLVVDPGRPLILGLFFDWYGSLETPIYLNRYFSLLFYGVEETFTFVEDPDDSGNQLPAQLYEEDVEVFLANVILYLQKNVNLSERYIIARGEPDFLGIYLTDKNNNKEIITPGDFDTRGLFFSPIQPGKAPEYTVNLRILAEIFVYINDVEVKVLQANMPTDNKGDASIDVSKPLTDVLRMHGMDDPIRTELLGKGVLRYYLSYREVYGPAQTTSPYQRTDDKYSVLGGVAKQLIGQSVAETLLQDGLVRFLVPGRIGIKRVLPDMPTWLSWVNVNDDLEEVEIRVRIFYTNDLEWEYTLDTIAVAKYGKIVIPTDMVSLGVADHYSEYVISSYAITLYHNHLPISDRYIYHIDKKYRPYARVFGYMNSFGSFQTWYSYGRKTKSYEIEKQTARISQVRDFELAVGEEIDFDISVRSKERINTGYMTKAETWALRDFFASPVKYMYVDGLWWPINIASSTIEESQDGDHLYSLAFDITGQHMEEVWGV